MTDAILLAVVRRLPQIALVTALILIVVGIAMMSVPAAFIASGIAILGAVTFDPARAGRLTWPR